MKASFRLISWGLFTLFALVSAARAGNSRSARSGDWSAPSTWEDGKIPGPGAIVLVRPGHRVIYDLQSEEVIRSVHVGGTLSFSREKDTLLCAGLVRIAPGEECSEEGFDCHAPRPAPAAPSEMAALEIGTADEPVPAGRKAVVRLTYVDGMDRLSFPALVCCGGRMDLHGAEVRPWIKLQESAHPLSSGILLAENATGWKPGDHLVITTTEQGEFYTEDGQGRRVIASVLDETQTEEAEILGVLGKGVMLKKPLKFKHRAEGNLRGEVANLTRNVVIESADPAGERGHTMYHGNSSGSISHAEFRHLGKKGILGRYPIHFHQCRDTMRGSSVVGASVWDSHNRWITIHGTDYLVVRDCVGFRSVGHGYFFEDGTEVLNVLDRNLAVQALMGTPQEGQFLPFDTNDGAGFWWANCFNTFTRNVAVDCDKHGYRFQMAKTETFDPRLLVRQADGRARKVDVRTLPFVRFEGNEAHSQRRFAFNLGGFHGQSTTADLDRDGNVIDRAAYLGGDVQGVGPDAKHPFRIKDFLVWSSHWGFHTTSPNVEIDGFSATDVNYVVWRSNISGHNYNRVDFRDIHVSSFFNNWGSGGGFGELLRYTDPLDDVPPSTVVTDVRWQPGNLVRVSGVSSDASALREVLVNGRPAELSGSVPGGWNITLPSGEGDLEILASAGDEAGNKELTPHRIVAKRRPPAPWIPAPVLPSLEEAIAGMPPQSPELPREAEIASAALSWPLWDGGESVSAYAERAGLEPSRRISVGGVELDLILIPAGSFLMGSKPDETGRAADEGPLHRVVISKPFYMGKTEITQAQYEKVAGRNPAHFKGATLPVEQVTWHEARAFAEKAGHGLRLPTEAEWEFACRAGTATPYAGDAASLGWYGHDGELERAYDAGHTSPVAGKTPNGFGLHDMHGNVYEWCQDVYAPDYYRDCPVVDPPGAAAGDERVLRGGSWEAPSSSARSANRNGFSPLSRGYVVGFRVVQPVSSSR